MTAEEVKDKKEEIHIFSSSDEESKAIREKLIKEYSYKGYYKTWNSSKTLAEREYEILSTLTNVLNLNNPKINVEIIDTDIDYQTEYQASLKKDKKEINTIHELSIDNQTNLTAGSQKEVVLLHGYGASLGLFYNNFEALSTLENTKVHVLDLLGFGLSSRPKFPKRKAKEKPTFECTYEKDIKDKETGEVKPTIVSESVNVKTSLEDVEIAENFFVDSLESWRKQKEIEKFTLIGHSLGGYLSSCYAIKYPERVTKLILLSPVGLETSSFDLTKDNNDTKTKIEVSEKDLNAAPDVQQEFPQDLHVNLSKLKKKGFLNSDTHGHVTVAPNMPSALKLFWRTEISPFSFVRKSYFLGPSVMKHWSFTRFMNLKDEAKILNMHEYCYACFAGKGSGEFCIPRILSPGILPYNPLLKRVPNNLQCESLWVYGDSDWMNSSAGAAMCKKINDIGKYKADFEIVSDAGHHMYLDNPKEFNSMILDYIKK